MSGARVSVVICTRNRARLLPALLTRVAGELGAGDEGIVVDNGSVDATKAAVAGEPALRYAFEAGPGLSRARNRGIAESSCEIVAFLDDDALPAAGWLNAHRRSYEDARVGAAGGPIELAFENPRPWWLTASYEQLLGRYDLGTKRHLYDEAVTPSGGNMSFRRRALDEVGLFDVDLGRRGDEHIAGEEYELVHRLYRAGWRALYEPSAVVAHLVPAERARIAFFRNRLRWNVETSILLEQRGLNRLGRRAELRHLAANVAADLLRVVRNRRGGDRIFNALLLEAHLVATRQALLRSRS